MAVTRYNAGLDRQGGGKWLTVTFRFILLKNGLYTPNVDHVFVADLTPGSNELTMSGYTRQDAAGKTRTVDSGLNRIIYDCNDPNFGTPIAGESVTDIVLYEFVSDDSDSIVVAHYPIATRATDGTPFVVAMPSTGATYAHAA